MTEADTCRKFVVPALQRASWDSEPHSIAEQRTITDGRIIPVGKGIWKTAGDGLQQAKEYAEMLGLYFAYSSNGPEILEFDYLTGKESVLSAYPTPDQLW